MADGEYSDCKEMYGSTLECVSSEDHCCLPRNPHYGFVNKTTSPDFDTTTLCIMLKPNQTIKGILNSNPIRFGEVLYINAYGTIMFAFLQFPKEISNEFDNSIEVEKIEILEQQEYVMFKNRNGKDCLITRHSSKGETVFKAIEKHISETKATTVKSSIDEFINHFTFVNSKTPITESKTINNDESCPKKLNNKSYKSKFTNNTSTSSTYKHPNHCFYTSHVTLPPESVISLMSHKTQLKVQPQQIQLKMQPLQRPLKMQPLQRLLKVQPPQVSVVCLAFPLFGAQHNNPAIPSYSTQVTEENGHSEITPSSIPYGQYGEVGNRAESLHTPSNETQNIGQALATNIIPVNNNQTVGATNTSNGLKTTDLIRGNERGNMTFSCTLPPNVPAEARPPARHPDYRDYYPRLLSYTNWPGNIRQDPTHLCQAGFFYTGNADLVRCFQCGIGLKDFRPDDEPLTEHVRYSADCNFLLELLGPAQLAEYKRTILGDNVNQGTFQQQPYQRQVPIVGATYQYNGLPGYTSQPSQQSAQHHQVIASYGQAPHLGPSDFRYTAMNHTSVTNQHYSTPTSQQGLQQTGQHSPISPNTSTGVIYRHPEYASLDTRLASFTKWPPGIMQTPSQIAEAGFYYTGMGDVVRCWACDGGLQKWDPQDDPWVEHCLYFPTCPYAIQQKGSGYIAMVQQHARGNTPVECQQNNATNSSVAQTNCSTSGIRDDIQKLTIQDNPVLETLASQSLLEMGYEDEQIKLAIEKLKRQGTTDPTAEQIVDIIEGGVENIPLNNNSQSSDMHRTTSEVFRENERLKSVLLCMACNENNVNVLFLPCTHHRMCTTCAKTVTHCPLCNRFIQEKVKTYMS